MILKQFIQYCLIGLSGVVVDMGVLFILCDSRVFCWAVVPGKLIASELAIINNFIWNDLWTFRDERRVNALRLPTWQRLARFNIICGFGLGLNVLLLTVMIRMLAINLYAANMLAILLVTLWNFSLNMLFNWRSHDAAGGKQKFAERQYRANNCRQS